MVNNKVYLSILIPAYNDTKCLVRVLDSLKFQTISKQLIVLISDDCSPNPIDIKKIDCFKDCFHKFLFTRQKTNLGVLTNPAWLFNQVETKFFTILQHDDVLIREDFYEDALNKLIENDNLVCYFGNSIIMRSKGKPLPKIDKKDPNNNLMYRLSNPEIKGLKNDNTMSGEDFIYNCTNLIINTAWSAIIFNTQETRKIGGFGGNYTISWFEAKSLNIYREEEYFACLFLLCFQGEIQLEEDPSVIRCIELTSFSESPTHPGIKMRQDAEIYALYKLVWVAEKLFQSKSAENIIRMIYKKCSKIPLNEESNKSKLFFKTYLPFEKEKQHLAINTIKSSRALRSQFEFLYKIKSILRFYRNVLKEKKAFKTILNNTKANKIKKR